MATLVLLRHAKAEPHGPTDAERPLALRGRDQARRAADLLSERGLVPDVVLCSTALRTRQTWAGLAAGLTASGGDAAAHVHYLEDLYSATPQVVRSLVAEHGTGARVLLVVGHEPIMSMTAAAYADADSDRAAVFSVRSGMPTASMAVIELTGFDDAAGRLTELVRA